MRWLLLPQDASISGERRGSIIDRRAAGCAVVESTFRIRDEGGFNVSTTQRRCILRWRSCSEISKEYASLHTCWCRIGFSHGGLVLHNSVVRNGHVKAVD